MKDSNDEVYFINSVSIRLAIIDLTNKQAREFAKKIIKQNLIEKGRAGGWMHDFGEYLPFDAKLSD